MFKTEKTISLIGIGMLIIAYIIFILQSFLPFNIIIPLLTNHQWLSSGIIFMNFIHLLGFLLGFLGLLLLSFDLINLKGPKKVILIITLSISLFISILKFIFNFLNIGIKILDISNPFILELPQVFNSINRVLILISDISFIVMLIVLLVILFNKKINYTNKYKNLLIFSIYLYLAIFLIFLIFNLIIFILRIQLTPSAFSIYFLFNIKHIASYTGITIFLIALFLFINNLKNPKNDLSENN